MTPQALVLPGGERNNTHRAKANLYHMALTINFPDRPVLAPVLVRYYCRPCGNLALFIDVEVARNAWGRQSFHLRLLQILYWTPG